MPNTMSSIIRSAKRTKDEPLNILTFPTHERYETGLCLTGHNFYAYRAEGIKDWNEQYGKCPPNYTLLDPKLKERQIPRWVEFDLVLSQNKFGQFQLAYPLSRKLGVPLISLEHTLPVPQWTTEQRNQLKEMRGNINVFISEYSLDQWWWDCRGDTTIIHHMVDADTFKPNENLSNGRITHILSVVNDWINRDWCCNFQGWQRITRNLPVRVVGDTPGFSKPAPSIGALVNEYQTSQVFLNTSTISPIPTVVLEAMACGCAVVSTATCMIPEIIEHGHSGFISNDEFELRKYCTELLNNKELAKKLGNNARKTIVEKFSKEQFIQNWNQVFWGVL